MEVQNNKFLEFNGKSIFFIAADGEYWIALKPICEALNLEWTRQFKNVKNDEVLSQLLAEQPMVGADNRTRKMISLPEFYVYGWIFQIQSASPELLQYKWECYKVLYQHFHGSITGRKNLLRQKAEAQVKISETLNKLDVIDLLNLESAKKTVNAINRQLRDLDASVITEERNLFTNAE